MNITAAAFLFLLPTTLLALDVDCEVDQQKADISYGTDEQGFAMDGVENNDLSVEISFE